MSDRILLEPLDVDDPEIVAAAFTAACTVVKSQTGSEPTRNVAGSACAA